MTRKPQSRDFRKHQHDTVHSDRRQQQRVSKGEQVKETLETLIKKLQCAKGLLRSRIVHLLEPGDVILYHSGPVRDHVDLATVTRVTSASVALRLKSRISVTIADACELRRLHRYELDKLKELENMPPGAARTETLSTYKSKLRHTTCPDDENRFERLWNKHIE